MIAAVGGVPMVLNIYYSLLARSPSGAAAGDAAEMMQCVDSDDGESDDGGEVMTKVDIPKKPSVSALNKSLRID